MKRKINLLFGRTRIKLSQIGRAMLYVIEIHTTYEFQLAFRSNYYYYYYI